MDVELKEFTKSFGKVIAVNNMNLEIEHGEFLVLLGPSGCGKTTALRMIAGLETIENGELYIGGKLMNEVLPKYRDVAMVFQSYALYPHMIVEDNIGYPLKMKGIKGEEKKDAILKAAKQVQLEEFLNRYPKQLSGGQRQRVALARALVRRPKVFLMDEPLSNLDAKLRGQMRSELKHLQHELNITTIYVTHDQIEAMTLADKIVIMNKGKIEQSGTPDDIYSNPNNIFVAEFIGNPKMNIFKVESEDIINKNTFKLFNNEIQFENLNFKNGLFVGIRPEDISLENKSEFEVKICVDLIENL